jgi:CHAD domain-containing protein
MRIPSHRAVPTSAPVNRQHMTEQKKLANDRYEGNQLTGLQGTMSNLARAKLLPLMDCVIEESSILTENAQPHDPRVKAYRKKLAALRFHLDLLAPVYPAEGANGDQWAQIRELLDSGYEAIGSFKDRFDAQGLQLAQFDQRTNSWSEGVRPNDVEYKRLDKVRADRETMLTWRASFDAEASAARDFLANPLDERLADRKRDDQSRFWWGGVHAQAKMKHNAGKNLKRLAKGVTKDALDDFDTIKDEGKIRGHHEEERVHDLRKRMRNLRNLFTVYPELLDDTDRIQAMEILRPAVDRYGNFGDLLTRRALKSKSSKKLDKAIDRQWDELIAWSRENKLKKHLQALAKDL